MATVALPQIARVLNLTVQRVTQLVSREGMPRTSRGQYDLGACMQWYIRYLQKALQGKSTETDGSVTNLMTQRTRQARETAERMQMANLKARGEVVLIVEVQHKAQKAIAYLGQDLDSVSQRVTADETLQEKIEDELRRARDRFADHLASLGGRPAALARGGEVDQEKAAPDAGGMGRPVPGATAGDTGAGAVAK
jgi:phage terminase Nu1 subunit (DNA packaging protein)